MRRRCILVLVAVFFLSGCTPSTPVEVVVPLAPVHDNLLKISTAYLGYTTAKHKPPQSVKDLRPLLADQGNPDEILKSPRDGQPLVICWGFDVMNPLASAPGTPVLAYEKKGVDGSRYVLISTPMGPMVQEMSDADFRAAQFPKGHHPEF